jgi:surfactin synthase thioesterase subunit
VGYRLAPWLPSLTDVAHPCIVLVAVPGAGGGPSRFRAWPRYLPEAALLFVAHLPGREGRFREPACTDLDSVADRLAEELARAPDAPTVLFGHSMGALIAFEVSRRLAGRRVLERLVVAASSAPSEPVVQPSSGELDNVALMRRLRDLGGTPSGVLADDELLQLHLPMLRADFAMADSYGDRTAMIDVPILALGGSGDQFVSPDELQRWANHTTWSFERRTVDGDHFFVHDQAEWVVNALLE